MNNVFLGFTRSLIRILVKIKFIFILLVIAICMPCSINFGFLSVCQGVSEYSNSFQMSTVGMFEAFSKIGRRTTESDINIMSQVDNFRQESAFKLSSSFFKTFFVSSAFAEEMGNQCPDSGGSQAKQETDSKISQRDYFFLFIGFLMGLCGSILSAVLYSILIRT